MLHLSLLAQRMTSLTAKINLPENAGKEEQVEIGSNYRFNVSYAEDNKHCKASLELRVFSTKDPSSLEINVSVEGIFESDELTSEDLKKEAHVLSYYMLFPYAQSLVVQMSISAALPPLIIPSDTMTTDKVSLSD